MKKNRKTVIVLLVIVALLSGMVWYLVRSGYFEDTGPTRLPTAEELERMAEIEETSNQVAPDARPGAGVRPPGSLPRPVVEDATSTATTSAEDAGEAGGDDGTDVPILIEDPAPPREVPEV